MNDFIHELPDEFPEHAERIEELKAADDHFAKLYDDYHEVNRAVLAAENLEAPTEHFHEEEMKKQRAALKDQLYKRLTG